MRVVAFSALALGTAACTNPKTATSPTLPENAYLIALDGAPLLFEQCSRDAPAFEGPLFQPTAADIVQLESKLRPLLADHSSEDGIEPALDFVSKPASYARQYVGYRASGRSMIYGNFFPEAGYADVKERLGKEAGGACDGGGAFFGVEYDLARQVITRVSFNGAVDGPWPRPIEP